MNAEHKTAIAENLLSWYQANQRDLPWRRRAADPYAVWVSEIMLQQTTVAAVTPYFDRWMQDFPTIRDLAAAPLDEVLKRWAGLGYYARARNLHRAAQQVVNDFDGVVPRDPATLKSLPGIGRYTAGAILSIAYNADEPIVDANVTRVVARLFVIKGDPKSNAATMAAIWLYAADLIPPGRASDFNQALMELGALVCDSASPRCVSCPLNMLCEAHRLGIASEYPQIRRDVRWTSHDDVSVALRNDRGEIALVKRSASASLWGGLWELPRSTRLEDEVLVDCAARVVREGLGVEASGLRSFGVVNHVVAKRKITLHGFVADCSRVDLSPAGYEELAWSTGSAAARYPMASPQVRLLRELALYESQGRLDID